MDNATQDSFLLDNGSRKPVFRVPRADTPSLRDLRNTSTEVITIGEQSKMGVFAEAFVVGDVDSGLTVLISPDEWVIDGLDQNRSGVLKDLKETELVYNLRTKLIFQVLGKIQGVHRIQMYMIDKNGERNPILDEILIKLSDSDITYEGLTADGGVILEIEIGDVTSDDIADRAIYTARR